MNKIFEDTFIEVQIDMIQICLEYVNNNADLIYIYASYEQNTISCGYFYKINGKLLERHKLNDNDTTIYDTSIQGQTACMKKLNEDMKKIISICKEYNRDIRTEIKLIYDVKNNKVSSNYKYELKYSNDTEKTADDMAEEWFDQERKLYYKN